MYFLAHLVGMAVNLYILIILLQVIMSWLIHLEMVNEENEQAKNLMGLLHKLTDPVFKPIRKFIPPVANMDFTPLIVIVGLQILASLLIPSFYYF